MFTLGSHADINRRIRSFGRRRGLAHALGDLDVLLDPATSERRWNETAGTSA